MKKNILIILIFALFGCGRQVSNLQDYILQAEKTIKENDTESIRKYASEYLNQAKEHLEKSRDILKKGEKDKYEIGVALSVKAQIYAEISKIIASSMEETDKEVSSAREAESKAKVQLEVIKATLERAKRSLPQLRTEIKKMIEQLNDELKKIEEIFESHETKKQSVK